MDIAGILAFIGIAIYLIARQVEKKNREKAAALRAQAAPTPQAAPPTTSAPQPVSIYSLSKAVHDAYQATAHPSDVLNITQFVDAAVTLANSGYTNEQLINYAGGDSGTVSSLALEALGRRREHANEIRPMLLQSLHSVGAPWARYLALRALNMLTPPNDPLILDVLGRIGSEWADSDRYTPQFLREFIRLRFAGGEVLDSQNISSRSAEQIGDALQALDPQDGKVLREVIELSASARVDTAWLGTVGRVWKEEDLGVDDVVITDPVESAVRELEATLSGERRRPALLVGEAGVGKRVLMRLVAKRLHEQGWTIFEAGANELLAGQMWFGQFEERMQLLVRNLRRRRVLWIIDNLAALILAGRHRHSQTGALDVLLPHLESGDVVMVASAEPAVYEKLLIEKPSVRTVFRGFRVQALQPDDALALAERWAESRRLDPATPLLSDDVLRDAWQLAMQYLGMKASPGNLLDLLKQTHTRLLAKGGRKSIESGDLIATLESLTGLPAAILDEREGLDLAALRAHFEERVVGQAEAVNTLVERVAMIKAGLTDPTRPLGVFLFAGPTGTGKTEIAKALAEFLFGSANRMLRIDMSELQTSESISRLLGDGEGAPAGGSLVEQIRRQPFSLVLLDEFEKSHPNVADLFLQLFDDGRLTDRRGVTADFRHALIIMTSNVGAAIQTTGRLGFSKDDGGFSAGTVRAALDKHFRKEFLNRIDRIVVFGPLSRETMRRILKHELNALYLRRGLRNRPWAVEWDSSAIDFLLDKGFTPDMGARPLKRAIDQHVLSPLAMAIVDRSLPEGEQFVYLRSDGEKLDIEFIDAEGGAEAPAAQVTPSTPALSLREIVAGARGTPEEIALLEAAYTAIERTVNSDAWRQKKEIDLSMTALPEFWRSPDRFEILTKAEYRDRVEAGLETATSMMHRLRQHKTPKLAERVAQQLFLLTNAIDALDANLPWEAFVHIDPGENGRELAEMMRRMYASWARRRGMRLEVLVDDARELLLSVSGFGAYSILRDEQGVHVLERPRDDGGSERLQVRLRVAPQPHEQIRANDALALVRAGDPALQIVRRYRELPSPLVRDAVRQWRTGRLDFVLDGNFDVMTSSD